MGATTGIAWTDSTQNWWIGCTNVGPGCDHCYAETLAVERMKLGWGTGAPRKRTSEHNRNSLARYQRAAPKFLAKHGRRQRVFCSSLSDIFDNEVPDEWRAEAFADMEAAPDVLVQICTKRVSNIAKMAPERWKSPDGCSSWPANVGVLITVVTPEEVLRDVPRLVDFKRRFGIPWIGLSIEPMITNVADALLDLGPVLQEVDWAIFGGESGHDARECVVSWIVQGVQICEEVGVSAFVKQLGSKASFGVGYFLKLKDRAGANPEEWPETFGYAALRTRRFPAALDGLRVDRTDIT